MTVEEIAIRRIVQNIYSNNLEMSKDFYLGFLEMDLVMDLGWVLTFASKQKPTAQINVFKNEGTENPDNSSVFLSIEVSDVDKMHERAENMNCDIIYKLTDESWGVRRFFVKDPNGVTINLLAQKKK